MTFTSSNQLLIYQLKKKITHDNVSVQFLKFPCVTAVSHVKLEELSKYFDKLTLAVSRK